MTSYNNQSSGVSSLSAPANGAVTHVTSAPPRKPQEAALDSGVTAYINSMTKENVLDGSWAYGLSDPDQCATPPQNWSEEEVTAATTKLALLFPREEANLASDKDIATHIDSMTRENIQDGSWLSSLAQCKTPLLLWKQQDFASTFAKMGAVGTEDLSTETAAAGAQPRENSSSSSTSYMISPAYALFMAFIQLMEYLNDMNRMQNQVAGMYAGVMAGMDKDGHIIGKGLIESFMDATIESAKQGAAATALQGWFSIGGGIFSALSVGGTILGPKLLGLSKKADMLQSKISAREALRAKITDRVAPPGGIAAIETPPAAAPLHVQAKEKLSQQEQHAAESQIDRMKMGDLDHKTENHAKLEQAAIDIANKDQLKEIGTQIDSHLKQLHDQLGAIQGSISRLSNIADLVGRAGTSITTGAGGVFGGAAQAKKGGADAEAAVMKQAGDQEQQNLNNATSAANQDHQAANNAASDMGRAVQAAYAGSGRG